MRTRHVAELLLLPVQAHRERVVRIVRLTHETKRLAGYEPVEERGARVVLEAGDMVEEDDLRWQLREIQPGADLFKLAMQPFILPRLVVLLSRVFETNLELIANLHHFAVAGADFGRIEARLDALCPGAHGLIHVCITRAAQLNQPIPRFAVVLQMAPQFILRRRAATIM